MQKTIAVGISMPKDLLSKIDVERQDVSRSRYLQRLVEKAYAVSVLGDKEVPIS
jgi:metal-responsive CopG/Arc/MetJ family transcriptional regulator